MKRTDLKPFNKMCLKEIRKLRTRMVGGGRDRIFFDELENILELNTSGEEWEQMKHDGIVVGEIWKQKIGEFHYKRRVHKFYYLYVSEGVVMDNYRHYKMVNKGGQKMPVKEWIIFPDGTMEMCNKREVHKLINGYKKPIYIVSISSMSSRAHY